MSVEETKYGTWRVRWRDINGTQRAKSFRTRSLAEKHERKVRAATEEGKPTASGRRPGLTVRAWSVQWLDGSHNLSHGARELYQEDVDLYILPALGDLDLRALEHDPSPIDAFIKAQLAAGRAPVSVHRYWRTLRRMFNVAVRRGKIDRSPMLDIDPPRVPKVEMRFLDAGRLEALAGVANGDTLFPGGEGPLWDYAALILTAGWGGLRWGECAGLRRRWVDRRKGGVHVMTQRTKTHRFEEPKGRNRRFVQLPESVLDLLADGDPDELVFTMPRGGPLVHSNWRRRVWVPAKAKVGVDPRFRFHDLRHTAVALAIKADAHPEAVKRRLGWSTIALMDDYGHLFPDVDEAIGDRLEAMRATARRPGLRAV